GNQKPAPLRCPRFSETAVRQLAKLLSRFCEMRSLDGRGVRLRRVCGFANAFKFAANMVGGFCDGFGDGRWRATYTQALPPVLIAAALAGAGGETSPAALDGTVLQDRRERP
ncbi:hypothetical protein, partial [Bradyrhizobium sp. 147]|uniref:hypothetical protein n=1 Tax=Bradyrhizobium sp. 147 TaxID=2782623 RepID=UPI001FF9B95C